MSTPQNSNTTPHTVDRRARLLSKTRKFGSPATDAARTAAEEEEEELCEEDRHGDEVRWGNVVRKGFGESHLEKDPLFALVRMLTNTMIDSFSAHCVQGNHNSRRDGRSAAQGLGLQEGLHALLSDRRLDSLALAFALSGWRFGLRLGVAR